MADISILGRRDTNIDYSIKNGRIRCFLYNGEILYNEDNNIAKIGWEQTLCKLVINLGLNKDRNGHGLFIFVSKLIDKGML